MAKLRARNRKEWLRFSYVPKHNGVANPDAEIIICYMSDGHVLSQHRIHGKLERPKLLRLPSGKIHKWSISTSLDDIRTVALKSGWTELKPRG